jgi:SAM-dependent methyltransferase
MEEPALWQHLGSVSGERVADLGCGDASIGPALLDAGCVSYYGADASAAMVAAAGKTLRGRTAVIERAGIEDFSFPPATFDLIISRLALHYVADVESVLRACAACLTPSGRLVFTVVHPVITSHDGRDDPGAVRTSWLVDDYFSRGPRHRPWLGGTVTWQHRTIEDYVSAVVRAGFTVEALSECPPQRSLFAGDADEFARRLRTPLFLLVSASIQVS